MMFDPKKNTGFLIALAVALVLLIVGIVLWRGAVGDADEAAGDLDSANEQYEALVGKHGGAPGKALVDFYKQRLADLKTEAGAMRNAVPEKQLPKYTPSSFKAELKTVRDKFVDLSADRNIRIPEDIGFAQFLGPEVPDRKELPKLVRQFAVIQDVLNELCSEKANVEEVAVIDRNPEGTGDEDDEFEDEEVYFEDGPAARADKTKGAAAEEEETIYDAVPVQFQFRTTPASLYTILAGIRNADQFYRIGKIRTTLDVQAMGEVHDPSDIVEALAVEFVVDHVVLHKDDEGEEK